MHTRLSAILCLFTAAVIPMAQAAETPSRTTWKLPNGLTVVVQEDHSFPLVAVFTSVDAGPKRETRMTSGLSHFLEHMVFKGTRARSVQEINSTAEKEGGYFNAFTTFDYTTYELVVPSSQLGEAVTLQLDMLSDAIFPPEELERERKVVIEEIQRANDDPVSRLMDLSAKALFAGHPYAEPILGPKNLIATMSREELARYYRTCYEPASMTVFVVGDVTPEGVRPVVEKACVDFFPGPGKKEALPQAKPIPKPVEQVEALDVTIGYFMWSVQGPGLKDPDYPAWDVLVTLMGSGESARLQVELVEEKDLATSVDGFLEDLELAGSWMGIYGTAEADKLDKVKAALAEQFKLLAAKPPDEQEATRARNKTLANFLFQEGTLPDKTETLVHFTAMGAQDILDTYADLLRKVTAQDIQGVAAKYLTGRPDVWAAVKPREAQESFVNAEAGLTPTPIPTPTPVPKSTAFRKKLENGLKIVARQSLSAPLTCLTVFIDGGVVAEQPGKNGTAALMLDLLDRGAGKYSAEDIARYLDEWGMEFSQSPELDYLKLSLQMTADRTQEGLDLLAVFLKDPDFPKKEYDIQARQLAGELQQEQDDISTVTYQLFMETLAPAHPYQRRTSGRLADLKKIKLGDVTSLAKKLLTPGNLTIAIVGNEDPEVLAGYVEARLGSMKSRIAELADLGPFPGKGAPETQALAANTQPREQAYLILGTKAPGYYDKEYASCLLLKEILNGNTPMRIWRLREEQGLAYEIGAQYTPHKEGGAFFIAMGTSPSKVQEAMKGVGFELAKISEVLLTDREVEAARKRLIGRFERNISSMPALSDYLAFAEWLGAGPEYFSRLKEVLGKLTPSDLYLTAKKLFSGAGQVTVATGPLSKEDLKQAVGM